MKRQRHAVAMMRTVLVVGLFMLADVGVAQVRPRGARTAARGRSANVTRVPLLVRTFVGAGRRTLVPTPQFQTNSRQGRSGYRIGGERGSDWACVHVDYDTDPLWIDDVTVNYFVLALTEADGERAYSFYRLAVTYRDVGRGAGHRSAAYLHPSAVARFGEPVASHVEILVDGSVVATEDDLRGDMEGQLPETWWTSKQVIDNPKVTMREGYLKHRDETPFALVNTENNEVIK